MANGFSRSAGRTEAEALPRPVQLRAAPPRTAPPRRSKPRPSTCTPSRSNTTGSVPVASRRAFDAGSPSTRAKVPPEFTEFEFDREGTVITRLAEALDRRPVIAFGAPHSRVGPFGRLPPPRPATPFLSGRGASSLIPGAMLLRSGKAPSSRSKTPREPNRHWGGDTSRSRAGQERITRQIRHPAAGGDRSPSDEPPPGKGRVT